MATAETPKRSWKRTVASTVEGRTPRFLLGSLALAMVISLIAGLGIGVKVGEHRKTTTKQAAVEHPPATRKRVKVVTAFAPPPLKGVVVRTAARVTRGLDRQKRRSPWASCPARTWKRRRWRASPTSRPDPASSSCSTRRARPRPRAPRPPPATAKATGAAGPPVYAAKEILIISGACCRTAWVRWSRR